MIKFAAFLSLVMLVAFLSQAYAAAPKASDAEPKSPLDFKMKSIDGKEVDLSKYKGKVVLMVNVASKCGNTPQYATLEAMYKKHAADGLVILGFPANEFGKQEPGSNKEIAEFCTSKYGVTFDMFEKIVVKGEGINPLYQHLISSDTDPKFAGDITWNFEKFVFNRHGQLIARFAPRVKPDAPEVVEVIEQELAAK